jgi:hypothetical protein
MPDDLLDWLGEVVWHVVMTQKIGSTIFPSQRHAKLEAKPHVVQDIVQPGFTCVQDGAAYARVLRSIKADGSGIRYGYR